MRILNLTPAVEKQLLCSRQRHDRQAERIAARIIADVRLRGDRALFAWSRKLDGVDLRREPLWIPPQDLGVATRNVTADFLRAVEHSARNIRKIAEQQLPRPWSISVEPGVQISQLVRPIQGIGCYIPGGRHTLLSTLLMTAVPAQVAGVPRIVVVCPRPNAEMLVVADFLGIKEIARIGGAQAIAALAYGTKSIPRVEKIFGPGNRFVTAAKWLVANDCAMDLPAGPTEAVVLAEDGNPQWIAADLLAQAEHAPDAGSFLVTTSHALARSVRSEIEKQLRCLARTSHAHAPLKNAGLILLARSLKDACAFVNHFAPEHLSLPAGDDSLLKQIHSAGTVFVGPWAAQPLGDYASGSNHVLPTGGWARKRGGLSAADFVKCISVQAIDRRGLASLATDVTLLAKAEGLTAHSNAIEVRL